MRDAVRPRGAWLPLLWGLILAGAAGDAAAGQSPTPDVGAAPPPSRFLIESIAVEGTERASVRGIVLSESRLVAGREYEEVEIRDAVRRVRRLPFVLDARPALRRGAAPGRYQLVIEIKQDARVSLFAHGGYDGDTDSRSGSVGLGVDHFMGAATQLAGSVSVSDGSGPLSRASSGGSLQFRRYDLAGHASRLELSLGAWRSGRSHGQSLSGSLVLPVSGNQSVRFALDGARSRFAGRDEPFAIAASSSSSAGASASWIYDTTDDAYAALDGTRLSGDAGIQRSWGSFHASSDYGAGVSASHVRRLGPKLGVEAGASFDCANGGRVSGACYGTPELRLRFVESGRRNSFRAFAEMGVRAHFSISGELRSASSGYLAVGLRSRLAVISLSYGRSL